MRIEQNHFNASHSTSIGEMMSPVMNKRSFKMPRAFFFGGRCGTNSATGLPFLVITTAWPVRSTSSMMARHLALNSDAFMIRDMAHFPYMTMVMTMVIYSLSETDVPLAFCRIIHIAR